MLRSMTGFGRCRLEFERREVLTEIRSVNHRYFEFNPRTPRTCGFLDEKLKSLVGESISRGKVEFSVFIYNKEGVSADIAVNEEIALGYLGALRQAAPVLSLEDDLRLSDIMRLPDIFTVVKKADDEDEIWNEVRRSAEKALDQFIGMRKTEGEKLHDDIAGRLEFIEEAVAKVERRSPELTQSYREKLYAKISALVGDRNIEDSRILTEAAIFSEKTAVDEETVRLRSHISQMRSVIESDDPAGRRLDFLVQEMNREINTIGSKCSDLYITNIVLDVKSEIEKIREQIQNVE